MVKIIIVTTIAFIMSGCATLVSGLTGSPTSDSRIDYVMDNNIPWGGQIGPKTRIGNAIVDGKIVTGMTKEQVIASWGDPCGYCYGTRNNSYGDSWEYNVFGTGSQGAGRGTYVYFDRSGHVTGWSQ